MNALILTSGGLIAASVVNAWLQTGNSVAAFWIGSKNLRRFLRRDRVLGTAWSVGAMARRYSIPIRRNPELSTWTGASTAISKLHADVLITAVTGQIVPESILSLFPGRAVNFHPSLLPHYRGPRPREGMILDGKANLYGGVTLHCLAPGIDKGDIVGSRKSPYNAERGFIFWEVCLARAAGSLAQVELQDYLSGKLHPCPQPAKGGNYRTRRPNELILSRSSTASRVKWLCDNLGASGWLRFRSKDKMKCPVSHFIRELGPRTLEEDRINKFAIEFDASDARVRVARSRSWTPAMRTGARLWAIAQTSRLVLQSDTTSSGL